MSERTLQVMEGGRIPVAIGDVAEVELLELLGSGGFGSVWKVKDCATVKIYVLKIIQGIIPDSIIVERVRLEAEVSVPSKYIIPVIGLCEWDASTFLILFEYFSGTSLDNLLASSRLTSQQKKDIFNQILLGVSDAHHNNIIHRDLKPANILVGEDGLVKIIDFGISKFKEKGISVSGEIFGTLPYMAPELWLYGSKIADARADIYALGHVLYTMAMGDHFWTRKGWRALKDFALYLKQTPPPTEAIDLSDFHCEFYHQAQRVLSRMVKINSNERYADLDDVLSDLGYVADLPKTPQDLNLRSPLLIVESGSNRGARTVASIKDGESLVLGRADIAGNDSSISRRHVRLSRVGESYFVADLSSKNGTLVGGIALEASAPPVEIRHGDRIKIGDVFLRFVFLQEV